MGQDAKIRTFSKGVLLAPDHHSLVHHSVLTHSCERVPHGMSATPYRAVGCVRAAEVGTRAGAEVGVVALRFMDPFPAQILSEVNVERAHTAVLLQIATTTKKTFIDHQPEGNHQYEKLHQRPSYLYLESFLVILRGGPNQWNPRFKCTEQYIP